MLQQKALGENHVFDRDHGEKDAVGLASVGVERGRAGRTRAAPKDVRAYDEIAIGIYRLLGAYNEIPPAGPFVVSRVIAGHVCVARQRVYDEDDVVLRCRELAVGLVGDRDVLDLSS
jgi:hypothetical protein